MTKTIELYTSWAVLWNRKTRTPEMRLLVDVLAENLTDCGKDTIPAKTIVGIQESEERARRLMAGLKKCAQCQ